MNILYLLIILILLIIFYRIQIKEYFMESIDIMDIKEGIPLESTIKPDYLPHKVSDYYYCGKLVSHNYNKLEEIYLYGKPIEPVHNLYSYYVFYVKNKEIIDNFSLIPHKKYNIGDPIFIKNGPVNDGPYILH